MDIRVFLSAFSAFSASHFLLTEKKIEPVITQRFPILEAARANALMETGQVVGNGVLQAPDSFLASLFVSADPFNKTIACPKQTVNQGFNIS